LEALVDNVKDGNEIIQKTKNRRFFITSGAVFQAIMGSADTLVGTYAMLYAVARGSVGLIQGIIVSIRELGSSLLQPIWGYYSDRYGRKGFVIIGLFIQSIAWGLLFPMATTPSKILAVFIFQTTLGTMIIPTWISWIGDQTVIRNRRRTIGLLGAAGAWTGLIALLIVSYFMQRQDPDREFVSTYSIAFRIAGVLYLIAIVIVIIIPQKKMVINPQLSQKKTAGIYQTRISPILSNIKALKPEFRKFLTIEGFFRLMWSFAWPIFPYATLAATNNWSEIAYLTIGMAIAAGISQLYGGRLSDRIGRNKVILATRVILILPPILYGLGAKYQMPILLFISNMAVGLIIGAGNVAVNSLILDIAPKEQQGTYVSIYLTTMGILAFTGSLLMGTVLLVVSADDVPSSNLLLTLFGIVAVGRLIAWFGYFFLPVEELFINARED
jgi:MFS family permease